jgi:hypothetical protein
VQVRVLGVTVSDDGGEKSNVSLSTGAVVIGRAAAGTFTMKDCGYFSVETGSSGSLENATTGWRVEITPIRVVDRAVTFRLRWIRTLDRDKSLTPTMPPSEDVELTLRPGEARPMDNVPVPSGAKTFDQRPCKARAASLRVLVDHYPMEEFDRRLIGADIWLIERPQNGPERSQLQTLRGLPNRPLHFYFDSIVEGAASLDILGRVVARPESGGLDVSIQTRSHWGDTSTLDRSEGSRNGARWVESSIHVKPEEIVEVGLPKLGADAGTFANRTFSIRVRARRLR